MFDPTNLHGITPPMCMPFTEAELQERLLMCFFELIAQGDAGYSASAWALGGFKAGLKVKGVIRSTCAGAPLHSFSAAEEERVADVMRRHGFL